MFSFIQGSTWCCLVWRCCTLFFLPVCSRSCYSLQSGHDKSNDLEMCYTFSATWLHLVAPSKCFVTWEQESPPLLETPRLSEREREPVNSPGQMASTACAPVTEVVSVIEEVSHTHSSDSEAVGAESTVCKMNHCDRLNRFVLPISLPCYHASICQL